jgi:GNAT superfamily N-acetyltransferase
VVTGPHVLRPAAPADADAIAGLTLEGFESFRSFAPAGWEPPPVASEAARVRELLAQEGSWWVVADHEGALVGHASFVPVALSVHAVDDPGLAHVRALFVTRALWGSGLATELHAAAVAAARERGYTALRLFTPAEQARARRFYEREGWTAAGPPAFEPALGLELVEYRLALDA